MEVPALPWPHASRGTALGRTTTASLNERRHTCLTLPWHCLFQAAFIACFAAHSLGVCLRPRKITLHPAPVFVPHPLPFRLRAAAERTPHACPPALAASAHPKGMKTPHSQHPSPTAPAPSFKPLYPTCSALSTAQPLFPRSSLRRSPDVSRLLDPILFQYRLSDDDLSKTSTAPSDLSKRAQSSLV